MRYGIYIIIIFLAAATYLVVREWVDRKKEKALDMEIVRADEEHLGSWAHKSPEVLIRFRLHRDGKFTYSSVEYPHGDSTALKGKYEIIGVVGDRSADYYPRLVAVSDKNDTVFNHLIAYITPYDTKVSTLDKMILNRNSVYDTLGYTFYRVSQN